MAFEEPVRQVPGRHPQACGGSCLHAWHPRCSQLKPGPSARALFPVRHGQCELDERGALESIASRLAPTASAWARSLVGAGLPAMVVNDN
ncbi:hypothetical protein C1X65_28130, partial [Pseudomonas sp. FW305-70]